MVRGVHVLKFVAVWVAVLFLPAVALAQERGFASGLGGVTFGTVSGADIAGRGGVTVSKYVNVFGEIGRMANVLPTADQQAITDATSALASETGGVPTVIGKMPSGYGLGGVRFTSPPQRRIGPYAETSFGFAHLRNDVTATVDTTDVTAQVATPLIAALPETDPILTFGGGVTIAAGKRSAVDLGYRFSRIFATDQHIDTGKLYAGIRVGF